MSVPKDELFRSPAVLFPFGALGDGPIKIAMVVGTVLWFAASPYCLKGAKA